MSHAEYWTNRAVELEKEFNKSRKSCSDILEYLGYASRQSTQWEKLPEEIENRLEKLGGSLLRRGIDIDSLEAELERLQTETENARGALNQANAWAAWEIKADRRLAAIKREDEKLDATIWAYVWVIVMFFPFIVFGLYMVVYFFTR